MNVGDCTWQTFFFNTLERTVDLAIISHRSHLNISFLPSHRQNILALFRVDNSLLLFNPTRIHVCVIVYLFINFATHVQHSFFYLPRNLHRLVTSDSHIVP